MATVLTYRIEVTGTDTQVKALGTHEIALKKLSTVTRGLEKDALKLAAKNREGGKVFKGLTEAIGKNKEETLKLRAAKNGLTKTITNNIKLSRTSANTIGQVSAQLAIQRKRINDVVIGSKRFKIIARRIKELETKQRDFNAQLGRGRTFVGEYSKGAIDAFKKVALAVGGALIAFRAIQRSLGGTISIIADFEKSFTNVITLLSSEDAKKFREPLEKGAIQIIKDYGLSIEDVNKALFDAISAGVSAGNAIEFLNEAAILSIGGVTDLKTSVDGITTVMNAFGIEQENVNKISAAFFSAQVFGKTTVEELSASIGQVAPIAKQANLSFQEVLSTLALLTKQGLRTDLATTALRSTIAALIKPSKEAAREFERLGIPFGASGLKGAGLAKVLVKIAEAAEEDSDTLAKLIPNIRALTGVGALGTEQLKEYDEILRVVNEDFGEGSSLSRAFALQQEALTDKGSRFIGVLKSLVLLFSEGLKPALKDVVDIGIDTLNFIIENERTIKGLFKILVSLVGIYIAWKGTLIASNLATKALNASQVLLATTSNRLALLQQKAAAQTIGLTIAQKAQRIATIAGAVAMRILNAVMKANPIGLVVIALAALIGGLKLLEKTSERNIVLTRRTGELNELLKKALNDTDIARGKNNKQIKIFNELSKLEQDTLIQTIKNQKLKAISDLQASERRRKDIAEQATQLTLLQKIEVGLFSFGNTARVASLIATKSIKNQTEATEEFNESINQLKQDIIELDKTQGDLIKTQEIAAEEFKKRIEEIAEELTEKEIKALKKAEKESKKIREEFAEERRLAAMTEEGRERDALSKKVDELRKSKVKESEINEFFEKEEVRITKKFRKIAADDRLKDIQDSVIAHQRGMALRIAILEQEFRLGEGIFKDAEDAEKLFAEEKLKIREETLEGVRQILEAELETMTVSLGEMNITDTLLSEEQMEIFKLRIEEIKAELAGISATEEDDEEGIKTLAEMLGIDEDGVDAINASVGAIMGIMSEMAALQNTITNEAVKANDKETKANIKNIDKKIKAAQAEGNNTDALEKQKQDLIEANDAKNLKLQEEQFKKNQSLAIVGVIIESALAIVKGFSQLGPLAGAISAVGIAIMAGIQISNIKKQTFEEGGILDGASHAGGGIPFSINGRGGFEAEGNEILVNKNIHSRPDFVDAISEMNYITGGKRFAHGGVLPSPNIRQAQQQAIFHDAMTREEAVDLIQEGITTIRVEQVESEVTGAQKTVETIESGAEF